jgi:MSHA biogenesis protein MshO
MRPMPRHSRPVRGVTLIEMVIVISITAIIAGGVAVFISRPFEGYIDAARRAELSDIADTALRRITRDLRTALPNSIRYQQVGGVFYLEYLRTKGGGRYRADFEGAGGGDPLDFTVEDPSFDVLGPPISLDTGDSIVIFNLAWSGTIANAYLTNNNRAATSSTGTVSTITFPPPGFKFPNPSPGRRFHVVDYAVTYECNPTTGELKRYWSYGIPATQATPPVGGSSALLANGVTACDITYTTAGGERTSVVGLAVRIGSGESVRLFQQVHVNNAP